MHCLDGILFGFLKGYNIKFMANKPTGLHCVDAADFLSGILPPGAPCPVGKLAGGQTLTVLLTRADHRPSDDNLEYNHFFPLWSQADVERLTGSSFDKVVDDEREHFEVEKQRLVDELTAAAPTMDDEEAQIQVDDLRVHINSINHFEHLFVRLVEAGYFGREVAAEGNCLVWAMLSCASKQPLLSFDCSESAHAEMMQFRTDVSHA